MVHDFTCLAPDGEDPLLLAFFTTARGFVPCSSYILPDGWVFSSLNTSLLRYELLIHVSVAVPTLTFYYVHIDCIAVLPAR